MAKCKNDVLLKKIKIDKLDKQNMELFFTVYDELENCRNIIAKNFVDISGGYSYNKFSRPDNQFECESTACMTGTLYQDAAGSVTYRAMYDATEFASGVLTFYVKTDEDTTVKVELADDSAFENADVYNVAIKAADAKDDGYIAVVVDLSQMPDSVTGEGWNATDEGVYIRLTSEAPVGISSLSIYDSMDDFEISDVVVLGCVDSIDGTEDIDLAEAECGGSSYTTDAPTFTKTVTAYQVTPNYRKMSPFIRKGENVEGFENANIQKTVTATEDGKYGVITIPDMADDCGFVYVSIADGCNVTDAKLERLSVPSVVDMDEQHFVVVRDADGITKIYVNKALVGAELTISYPRTAEVTEYIATANDLNSRRGRLAYKYQQSDGVTIMRVYDNVFVTSFPGTINTEETSFAVTFTFAMADNGHYYREWVIEA